MLLAQHGVGAAPLGETVENADPDDAATDDDDLGSGFHGATILLSDAMS